MEVYSLVMGMSPLTLGMPVTFWETGSNRKKRGVSKFKTSEAHIVYMAGHLKCQNRKSMENRKSTAQVIELTMHGCDSRQIAISSLADGGTIYFRRISLGGESRQADAFGTRQA